MAVYQPSSLFSAIFMKRMEVEANKSVKKKTRQVSSYLDRTSFVSNGFITWQKDLTSKAQLCLKHSKPTRIVYVLLFFYCLRPSSGPSCPLGQPIRRQDSLPIAHGYCGRYNEGVYFNRQAVRRPLELNLIVFGAQISSLC